MNELRTQLQRRPAGVVAFLPVGYPSRQGFVECVQAAFAAGVRAVELGVPLAQASLDGEGIAAAFSDVNASLDEQITLSADVAQNGTTFAMVYAAGTDLQSRLQLAERLHAAGLHGVMVPDLSLPEQLDLADRVDIPAGIFISAKSDLDTLQKRTCPPPAFIYLRSSAHTTGQPLDLENTQRRIRDTQALLPQARTPLLVGFGIRTPAQVRAVTAAGADAVVVGSAVVDAARTGTAKLETLLRGLVEGAADD